MKRRSKVSQPGLAGRGAAAGKGLQVGETRGLVAPVSGKSGAVTLRLSGTWWTLWERLREAVPGVSDAELLRQGVAMRMAVAALDGKGLKPRAYIQYHDPSGRLHTVDLEKHVGIEPSGKTEK